MNINSKCNSIETQNFITSRVSQEALHFSLHNKNLSKLFTLRYFQTMDSMLYGAAKIFLGQFISKINYNISACFIQFPNLLQGVLVNF